ncbi:unnamed protein product [Spirodela intermedia]|uniref:Uncharacterized protein n=1 Tax=Spirodela intermedia TaxID=51605 RepID=A0A7I8KMF5_SPIIN|nr:unnamed protein product [Spirodela intermedia]
MDFTDSQQKNPKMMLKEYL